MEQQQKLCLLIEKGPRSGESLEFLSTNPPIKLGRVVRGNSLPIKDPGISTNHLIIEFKSIHWLITDLDSSNGTIVNSDHLKPLVPRVLVHGDSVKVGEVTVIRVLISGENRENEGDLGNGFVEDLGKKGPRGRSRREKAVDENLGEVEEKSELGFGGVLGKRVTRGRTRREKAVEDKVGETGEEDELGFDGNLGKKRPRGRTRREKAVEENVGVIEENIELGFGEELGKKAIVEGKRTRGRPKKEKVEIFTEDVGPVESIQGKRQVGTRSTRGSKNDTSRNLSNLSLDVEIGVVDEVFVKKTGRGQGRRGKEKANEGAELGPVKVEPCVQVSTRRTRSARVVENVEKVNAEGVKVAEKGKTRGSKRKVVSEEGSCSEKGNVIIVQSGDGLNSERVVVKSEPRESFCEVENSGKDNEEREKEEKEKEGDCNGSGLGQEECANASGSKDKEAPDLEKMTLGEYFDYLEVALPKQIIEETEIIIAEMHKKAEMYRELVRAHKDKGNNKLPVG